MASGQTQNAPKLSFATVAASQYTPSSQDNRENGTKSPSIEKPVPSTQMTDPPVIVQGDRSTDVKTLKVSEPPNDYASAPATMEQEINIGMNGPIDTSLAPPPTLERSPASDETNTPDSDDAGKPASVDGGKSVGSGTTFALDEKESLRPDDSASTRAIDEEDMFSVAGSRVGSDSGARAFRDQLREISVMGTNSQRLGMPGRLPSSQGPQTGQFPSVAAPVEPLAMRCSDQIPDASAGDKPQSPPDDKLMEALESPRDRIFVIKLEQDILDFIKDPKQHSLDLPQFNAFYRMLAHRLADYYQLGHVVDSFTSQSSVRLFKSASSRMPPPLSGIPIPSAGNTPPPAVQARKIMRRGEESATASGANTGANSENPSKCTSETGDGSGSDADQFGNDSKSKAALTREEREAKYREARERIFGQTEEVDKSDSVNDDEERDDSRASSAAGKKKTKKTRAANDDGFEARSQYIPQYSNSYGVPTYTPDGFYTPYNGMPPGHYAPMNGNVPTMYPGYGPVMAPDMQQQDYQWPQPINGNGMPMQGYPASNGYDMSADFNRGMQSFQSAPPMPGQNGVKVSPSLGSFPDIYGQQPRGPGWSQVGQFPPYQMQPQPSYGAQGIPTSNPYPYGQMPRAPFAGPRPNNQHPLPGSYNRNQFNPQSQAFIPGHRMGMNQMPPQVPQMNPPGMNMNQPPVGAVPQNHGNRSGPPSQFGSPRAGHTGLPTPPQQRQLVPNQHTPPRDQAQLPSPPPNPSNQGPSLASVQHNGSPNPQPNATIAKWGMPSHLPPKPPPPASVEPQRYLPNPLHRPPPHVYSMPPRHPGNPPISGVTNGVANVSLSGAGATTRK